MIDNPLLNNANTLPRWSDIDATHVAAAIEFLLEKSRYEIKQRLNKGAPFTWKNFAQPLEELADELNSAWAPISHLHGVKNSPELRAEYEKAQQQLTAYSTEMGQNNELYQAWQSLADSPEFNELTTAQRKMVNNELRDFTLAGVTLADDKKVIYGELKQQLSELTTNFSNNVLDATQAWFKHLPDATRLAGIPATVLPTLAQAAKARDLEGYALTLDFPCYLPVIQYCDDRELREEVYVVFSTRASKEGPGQSEWDNDDNMVAILSAREQLAQLLGFDSYAHRSLATKMADTPAEVMAFLQQLASSSLPVAQKDLAQLTAFAKANYGVSELQAWDVPYYSEKLREQEFSISPQELRPWFPADKVIAGMFEITARLYDVTISADTSIELYHDDVTFYRISRDEKELASFYLDAYAREHKRGGAWMADCRNRIKRADGSMQLPTAFLTCNFTPPTEGMPALLTHDEVTTLFHEFGHGLHHMLTQVETMSVAGISGVAWDAVELPSQFMENWCWQPEGLALISGHYETGEALPELKLQRLLAAKNFQSGLQMARQLEFSWFDMQIHLRKDLDSAAKIQQVLAEVRDAIAVIVPPEFNRFQNSFGHIFAGGYAAGYYSYKWAEVLSSDAFARFEEEGIFEGGAAKDFLEQILEQGGSREALDCFIAFRGRPPTVDALLRHSGIAKEEAV
jgi:oligopeptidase A